MVYNFFDKKSASLSQKPVAGSRVTTHRNKSAFNNEKLAEELHKAIIIKF